MARKRKYFTDDEKLKALKERQSRYYFRKKLGLNNLLVKKKNKFKKADPVASSSLTPLSTTPWTPAPERFDPTNPTAHVPWTQVEPSYATKPMGFFTNFNLPAISQSSLDPLAPNLDQSLTSNPVSSEPVKSNVVEDLTEKGNLGEA